MMKKLIFTTAFILLLGVHAFAKRAAPKEVAPVTIDDAVVSVPHFSEGKRAQNGGFLEARHPETKELLWRVQIYKTVYKKRFEKDVQDVFIKSLSFDRSHNLLIMSDERGRIFVLDLRSKKVTQIELGQDDTIQPAAAPEVKLKDIAIPEPESDECSE